MSNDNLAREALILRLFKGLPSWDGRVTRRIIDDYIEYVPEVRIDALKQAVENFRRGLVEGHDLAFPATGPELAKEAERIQAKLQNDEYWAKVEFIAYDSAEWKAMVEMRGRQMPVVERNYIKGWYVSRDDLDPLAPRIAELKQEMALLESPEHQAEMRRRIASIGIKVDGDA